MSIPNVILLPTNELDRLVVCIRSGQVPEKDIPRLCDKHPGLRERLLHHISSRA